MSTTPTDPPAKPLAQRAYESALRMAQGLSYTPKPEDFGLSADTPKPPDDPFINTLQ